MKRCVVLEGSAVIDQISIDKRLSIGCPMIPPRDAHGMLEIHSSIVRHVASNFYKRLLPSSIACPNLLIISDQPPHGLNDA